jgi:NB-ARC domain
VDVPKSEGGASFRASYGSVMRGSRRIAQAATAVPGVAACVFLIAVAVGQGVDRAGVWAGVLGLPVGLVAACAAVWAVALPRSTILVPPELEVPEWAVDRPAELAPVVAALAGGRAGTVGITTGLHGAGGFGKTTLALMVCADRRVRRRFRGQVYWVTVGRDVRGAAAIAAKVNDVIKLIGAVDAAFADPELAGRRLGALLDSGPRRLLVLDDVWWPEQLAPFTAGGHRCARLVTTRVPGLLPGRSPMVRVDQMSPDQARSVLTAGLPSLDPTVTNGLLTVTGRWPLLLRLVNKILVNANNAGADVAAAGAQLTAQLRAGGPTVVDDLSGQASHDLDVGQPAERALAVRATIGASLSLLDTPDAERFAELALFAEDEPIPFDLVAELWRATGGLNELASSQVIARLAEIDLVTSAGTAASGVRVHDVVRDFLRSELGQHSLAELNGVLLDEIARGLPAARPLVGLSPSPITVSWWELGQGAQYMRDHLIWHLLEAGRPLEAEGIACDLRWAGRRLLTSGPAAPRLTLVWWEPRGPPAYRLY